MRRRRQLLSAVSTDLAVPNASSITVTSQDSACRIGFTLSYFSQCNAVRSPSWARSSALMKTCVNKVKTCVSK
jgi:hypothetical protein